MSINGCRRHWPVCWSEFCFPGTCKRQAWLLPGMSLPHSLMKGLRRSSRLSAQTFVLLWFCRCPRRSCSHATAVRRDSTQQSHAALMDAGMKGAKYFPEAINGPVTGDGKSVKLPPKGREQPHAPLSAGRAGQTSR